MQFFLPYADIHQSWQVLDKVRHNNGINEALIQLKTLKGAYEEGGGWPHHPATLMWKGYEVALALAVQAGFAVYLEQYGDRKPPRPFQFLEFVEQEEYFAYDFEQPWWLGHPEFHASHRAALLFKDYEYYKDHLTHDDMLTESKWLERCREAGKPVYFWPTEHETERTNPCSASETTPSA